MSSGVYIWSQTAATDASADSTINWAEGMAPSAVNDSARAMMASVAKWRDDMGSNITTGGTSTAYTVATNQVFDTLAHLAGQELTFYVHATNGALPTLNVDGLGAKNIGIDINTGVPAGTLISGSPYTVVYNASLSIFLLKDFYGNPYNTPIGGMMDFIGSSVPNSNFVFPIGQAISRSTYATLFSLVSTTYGVGDGSTTFNVPDLTGRTVAMKEATATRLTTAGGGIDGGTLGAVGGVQNVTLASGQIPTLTSVNASQAINVTAGGSSLNVPTSGGSWTPFLANDGSTRNTTYAPSGNSTTNTFSGSNSISTTYTNGSQAVTKTVMPAIILNKILRII